MAHQTSKALRKIAGFPHLNLREQGGKLGTIKVHYLVGHSDFVSEDGQLTWRIPSTLISTFDVDAKSKDEALELAKECELGYPGDINFEIVEVYDYVNDDENDVLNEYRDMKEGEKE